MRTVHIVGAGLAGLACAVRLSGLSQCRVILYDAAGHAGGRCRSFFDDAMGRVIDNGNHLLLSGNTAVHDFLEETGADDSLVGPNEAAFPFVDLGTGERWTVRPNSGRLPWWILTPQRRVPNSRAVDYLAAIRLARAGPHETVADCLDRRSILFTRFWEPLAVSVLNTPAELGAARLLGRALAETFGRGGTACRPLIARQSLSESFVTPAISLLKRRRVELRLGHRLRGLIRNGGRVAALDFGAEEIILGLEDALILALPPNGVAALLPEINVPDGSHAIVNGHFRLDHAPTAPGEAPFLGIIGGTVQWLFLRGDVVSVTVSAADALAEEPAEAIAAKTWIDVSCALGLPAQPLPPHRIIKEKRATFAQTPTAIGLRPGVRTALPNLFLAGDWTDTSLPATIEGALRSGFTAARAVMSH